MKKLFTSFVFAAITLLGTAAHAQTHGIYAGAGLPGVATIGYAHSLSDRWGLRADYAGGINHSRDETRDGIAMTATLKASRTGLFADWYPFGGGFRFSGGVTFNDLYAQLNARGSGTANINGNTVNMTGETYNVKVFMPKTTPYVGIGYGHHRAQSGLGFYFDLGVHLGKFKVQSETTLVTAGKATQADIDAENAQLRDTVSKIGLVPSFSLGAAYRF
jgi:hypothetical protein